MPKRGLHWGQRQCIAGIVKEEQQERAHRTPHWSRGGLQPALSIHAESGDGQLSLLASREFSISK